MAILDELERNLKEAMLSGEKNRAEVIKSLKNALLYEAVAKQTSAAELSPEATLQVLAKEAKKRGEAATMYRQASEDARAETEEAEKAIIEEFLPAQVSEEEISKILNEEIDKLDNPSTKDMGRVIGAVKARLGASADGALIAKLTKEKLGS